VWNLVVALLALALTGCAGEPVSSPTATPRTTVAPATTQEPTEEPFGSRDDDDARAFRERFGLRADLTWIAAVAADPAGEPGMLEFGVPLLPFEVADLRGRVASSHLATPIIGAYAVSVPDDWYGSYIDQQRGGLIVIQVYRGVERHRAALARMLPARVLWEVRLVDDHILEMEALAEVIQDEREWFATIGAELLDVYVNAPLDGGIVELTYLSDRRDLAPLIQERFGPHDWLVVDWAGVPMGGRGTEGDLIVGVMNRWGAPVIGAPCHLGDLRDTTDVEGQCIFVEIVAEPYRLLVLSGPEPDSTAIVDREVEVVPGLLTRLRFGTTEP
jgi:hypothetical protein